MNKSTLNLRLMLALSMIGVAGTALMSAPALDPAPKRPVPDPVQSEKIAAANAKRARKAAKRRKVAPGNAL